MAVVDPRTDGSAQSDSKVQELRTRWLRLTRVELPQRARAERWPLREDHCFQRVVLDAVCGGRWYDVVSDRPAYRHLDIGRLRRAVELAEQLLSTEGVQLLRQLDDQSLRWRGKRAKTG